jgi:regulator of vacuolar morphogenesis
LDLHREMKTCLHEARLALARRDGAVDSHNSTAAAEAGAAAKKALVKGGSLATSLAGGLKALQEGGRLGDGELRRRRDLLSAVKAEKEGLEKISNSTASHLQGARSSAFGGTSGLSYSDAKNSLVGGSSSGGARAGGRVLGGPAPETERTRDQDNQGVLMLQRQQMEEQDQAVDQLGAIVRRQKEMGMQIRDEVDAQNEMLDQMHADVDRVQGKIKVANRRVKNL